MAGAQKSVALFLKSTLRDSKERSAWLHQTHNNAILGYIFEYFKSIAILFWNWSIEIYCITFFKKVSPVYPLLISMDFLQIGNFWIKPTKINWYLKSLSIQIVSQNIANSRIVAHNKMAIKTAKFCRIL